MFGIKEPNLLGYNGITWASVFLLMSFMLASKLRHPSAVMCRVMPEGWGITWCKMWCIFYLKKSTVIPDGYLSGITIKHEKEHEHFKKWNAHFLPMTHYWMNIRHLPFPLLQNAEYCTKECKNIRDKQSTSSVA
jgi:hypothetical protein